MSGIFRNHLQFFSLFPDVCELKSGEIHWVPLSDEELVHIDGGVSVASKRAERSDKGKKRGPFQQA